MKKIIFLILVVISLTNNSYSQLGDILKKIPGIGEVLEEPVSTSIQDAYPTAYWLRDLDKQIPVNAGESYSPDLSPGYYKFVFKTFCLHAGGYAPTQGTGYLAAPLKGTRAKMIQNILTRYDDHQEINQQDVQILIWGIESGQKFSSYPSDFQLRVAPLLTPDEIALMEVNVKEIALDLLPQDVKEILNFYKDLRTKLSDASTTYEQIEQVAVKTGIPPLGKGSRNVESGTWSSVGNGIYLRSFTYFFPESQVELYVPPEVTIQKDNTGRITSLDDGSFRIEFQYESNSSKFKSALLKNFSTNEEIAIENNLTNDASIKSQTDEFISLVKKSFGKKKSKSLNEESLKTLGQLKTIELSLSSLIEKSSWQANAYSTSVNALNGYISELENGKIKGGSERLSGFDIHGIVFAPSNTSVQREGNGGNKGKEKNCKPEVVLKRVSQLYYPLPGTSINMSIEIRNLGENCTVQEVKFRLLQASRELGRCINDKDPAWYDSRLDLYIDPVANGYFNVSADSLTAEANGSVTSISIGCNDYGAYGKLEAYVKVDNQWYPAKDEFSVKNYVNIPYDNDENGIADGWEAQYNVSGLPATWDEDPEPSGQARNGDGLTNYEEYRGVFVSDGSSGTEHVRTDPRKKELFVIDDDQIFSITSWKAASDITAYWLTKDLVYGDKSNDPKFYRLVNFCSGYATGAKFAIRLIKVDGMDDPYGNWADVHVLGYNDPSYGPPREANRTVMFPDRIRSWLLECAVNLENTLKQFPNGFAVEGVNYSKQEVQHFINEIRTPSKLDILVDFWMNLVVIHEVAHACNVYHHGGGDPDKTATGDPKCPTKYRSEFNAVKLDKTLSGIMDIIEKQGIAPIVIYTGWRFCKTKDNCWKQLDVNDR